MKEPRKEHPPRHPEAGVRRTGDELDKMRRAGRVVAEMHEVTRAAIRPGVTTYALNEVAAEVLSRRRARSSILHYRGFPAVICTSPNNMVIHGIPGSYALKEGDLISIDCAASVEGYHADAAYTAPVGEVSELAKRLLEVTERSLWTGIDSLVVGQHLHEVGRSIQRVAEAAGFSVVRGYVGHGIGTQMHESPDVPNYWPGTPGPTIKEGMVFAVEPMVNTGGLETYRLSDGWSVMTKGGSLSAHFEHTIAVTDQGPEVFTVA
jgi:methionyl aminopeptidase